MEIRCEFTECKCPHERIFYVCKIMNQIIPNCELNFVGNHILGMNNNHVQEVRFVNCSIDHVPQRLMKIYPFMEDLSIWESNIKAIYKDDLAEYKLLKRVYIMNSHIEFLPSDLFEDFQNLEEISFEANNLVLIEPNILDGLNNLKSVCFSDNPKYNKSYSIYPEYESNATLAEVKNELYLVYKTYKDIMQKQLASVETQTDNVYIPKEPESQKGIFNDFKNYIQNERFKDFKVQIGEREFPVHKFLLAARSLTLAEILLNNPEIEQLNLVDIPVDIFETILKFVYTDEFPSIERLDALRLFAAAGRLKIEELKNFAATNFYDKINRQNALEVLELSNKYEHSELKKKAFEKIQIEYPKIRFKDNWANKPEYVAKVIEKFEKKEKIMKMLEEKFEKDLLLSD